MLTTAIAAVFWASDKSDINWLIYLAGWQAWGFLGVAHIYYVVSWRQWRGRLFIEPQRPTNELEKAVADKEHQRGRWYLSHKLTDLAAIFGATIIVGNFLRALMNSGIL